MSERKEILVLREMTKESSLEKVLSAVDRGATVFVLSTSPQVVMSLISEALTRGDGERGFGVKIEAFGASGPIVFAPKSARLKRRKDSLTIQL